MFSVNPDSLYPAVEIDLNWLDPPEEPREPSFNLAQGRLANARTWFKHRGCNVLPQNERGWRILRWGADHAYLASPTNPIRSVLRWIRRWAPWLTEDEIDQLIAYVRASNKRWSHDQSAIVLGVSLDDRLALKLRFIGACDDPNYDRRRDMIRVRDTERQRRHRAKNKTRATPGRPKSDVPAWKAAGFNSKRTYHRHKAREPLGGTKNMSRDINIRKSVTGFRCHKTKPENSLAENRRKPAPNHSKTADRKDARCREYSNRRISEQDVLTNSRLGDIDRRIGHKSRMSERMPMRKDHWTIAREAGVSDPARQFETFKDFHLATGLWSWDWTGAWRNWCRKSLEFNAEWRRRDRAQVEANPSNYVDGRL